MALMKYMVGHNASHANELANLAKQLQEICGSVYVENTSLCELPEKEHAGRERL